MNKDKLSEYRDYLLYLANGGEPHNNLGGVCLSFRVEFNVYLHYEIPHYYDIIQDFEYYSGCKVYPIQGEMVCPEKEFYTTEKKWIGEYGRRRRLFCKFLADYLHKIINDNTITGDK